MTPTDFLAAYLIGALLPIVAATYIRLTSPTSRAGTRASARLILASPIWPILIPLLVALAIKAAGAGLSQLIREAELPTRKSRR